MRECVDAFLRRTFPGSDADTYLLLLRDEHADVGVGGGEVAPRRRRTDPPGSPAAARRTRRETPSPHAPLGVRRMLSFFVNTSRKRRGKELDSHARASANRERKRTGMSVDWRTPSTLIERPKGRSSLQKITNDRRSLSRNAPQEGAFGSLSRRRSAHFTRAARSHTHPSHFHPASAHESATALARTHARSTRTRSRPAEAFLARPRI